MFQLLLKKSPQNKWGGEGQAGGELLAGAAAAALKGLCSLRTPRRRRGLGKPSWEGTQKTKGQDFVPSFLNR